MSEGVGGSVGADAVQVTLAQIVAALAVTYTDSGVATWLSARNRQLRIDGWVTSPAVFIAEGRIAEVADAVRRIGDADPSDFTITEKPRRSTGCACGRTDEHGPHEERSDV